MGRTGRGPMGGWGCRGASSGGVGGPLTVCGDVEKSQGQKKDTGFPITFPNYPPHTHTHQSPAVRILIPEYLAPPSMATVALPPCTASASFLPAPSPCSPLLSLEPGFQRGCAPSGRWPVCPPSEEGLACITQRRHRAPPKPEPQNHQALGHRIQGPG